PTQLIAVVPGVYQISGTVIWESVANAPGTSRGLAIRLGGLEFIAFDSIVPEANAAGQTISTMIELALGNFVELVALQNTTAAVNILKSPDPSLSKASPEFMMVRVA